MTTNCNCYNHIKHIARATWICTECKRDVSLEVVVAYKSGIDLLTGNKVKHDTTNIDYKQKCLDIYYASDVVDKSLTMGCAVEQEKTGVRGLLVGTPENENGFGYWFNHNNTIYPILEEHIKIIGHHPTGFDWLRLIEVNHPRWVFSPFGVKIGIVNSDGIDWQMIPFNLTTQEPTDWKALYEIIK